MKVLLTPSKNATVKVTSWTKSKKRYAFQVLALKSLANFFNFFREHGETGQFYTIFSKKKCKALLFGRHSLTQSSQCLALALITADWEAEWRQIQIQPIKIQWRRRKTYLRRKNLSCFFYIFGLKIFAIWRRKMAR